VRVLFGRWQDVLPKLDEPQFDGVHILAALLYALFLADAVLLPCYARARACAPQSFSIMYSLLR
jgi:hypothetical protein